MNLIMDFFNKDMIQPEFYTTFDKSWFHYLFLILLFVGMFFSVKLMRKMSNKEIKKTLLIFSLILIVFEIYKQLIFSYQANWSYQWYAFPFQFCSTPMYVALLAGLTKNKKIEEALYAFLATFGFFAGAAVMFYPATVFISTIGINIQTMVHHGLTAIIGIGLLSSKIKLESKTIIKAFIVFAFLVLIAVTLNITFNKFIVNGTFNMFFINPMFENALPVLSLFQPLVPPTIFILIYLFGFTFVAFVVLETAIIIKKLDAFIKNNKNINKDLSATPQN